MERPSVRNFLYRSKWFQRPSVLALRTAMRGSGVAVASFLSLVAALFCGDVCALLGVAGNAWCDAVLSVAFGFFVLEFLLNAASDRSALEIEAWHVAHRHVQNCLCLYYYCI